jgi:hypothetical protein
MSGQHGKNVNSRRRNPERRFSGDDEAGIEGHGKDRFHPDFL